MRGKQCVHGRLSVDSGYNLTPWLLFCHALSNWPLFLFTFQPNYIGIVCTHLNFRQLVERCSDFARYYFFSSLTVPTWNIFWWQDQDNENVKINREWKYLDTPGARFSKVPIINGPGKLSPFTSKIEVSIVLHLTCQNMIKLSANETKWSSLLARTRALILIFRFVYLISGPKNYRDFRETGPCSVSSGYWCYPYT